MLPQLSIATGLLNETTAEHTSGAAVTVISEGQELITGISFTVTLNEQLVELPETSVAVNVTVVVPIGKAEPEAESNSTLTPPEKCVY